MTSVFALRFAQDDICFSTSLRAPLKMTFVFFALRFAQDEICFFALRSAQDDICFSVTSILYLGSRGAGFILLLAGFGGL
jgi:hypothetical protein